MIRSSCHCGAVRMEISEAPATVTDCNCSICRRLGTLWAYYRPEQVTRSGGATDIYMWGDRDIEFHRCRVCGCITHWEAADKAKADRMGVNARLMEIESFDGIAIRKFDGASM